MRGCRLSDRPPAASCLPASCPLVNNCIVRSGYMGAPRTRRVSTCVAGVQRARGAKESGKGVRGEGSRKGERAEGPSRHAHGRVGAGLGRGGWQRGACTRS